MKLRLGLVLLALAGAPVALAACNLEEEWAKLAEEGRQAEQVRTQGAAPESSTPAAAPAVTITVASFNIQVFGSAKEAQPEVMEVLAAVVRRFDVVAIQEIRSQDQELLPRFVARLNAAGGTYDYVLGPRLGRTSSKEQYAFVFNTRRVEVDRFSVYTLGDPADLLHREPLVASFRAVGPPVEQVFSFTLVNIHTDPDEVPAELDALADVFLAVRNSGRGEDDVILLGDLNTDDRRLYRLGTLPGATPLIRGVTTNTRRTETYDNLIVDGRSTAEFTGQAGVLDLQQEFQLTLDQALEVSDHQPVWAAFQVYEGGAAASIAARPDGAAR